MQATKTRKPIVYPTLAHAFRVSAAGPARVIEESRTGWSVDPGNLAATRRLILALAWLAPNRTGRQALARHFLSFHRGNSNRGFWDVAEGALFDIKGPGHHVKRPSLYLLVNLADIFPEYADAH